MILALARVIWLPVVLGLGELAPVQVMGYQTQAGAGGAGVAARAPQSSGMLCPRGLLPSTLEVRRTPDHPQPNLLNTSPLYRPIVGSRAVEKLYAAVCMLPSQPHGVVSSCGGSFGTTYHLRFRTGRALLLSARFSSGGCPTLVMSRPNRQPQPYWAGGSPVFCWLARALGISEVDLFPYVKGHRPLPPQDEQLCAGR